MDGRKNNGGHSTKGRAGRKPKAEEQKTAAICRAALIRIYGDDEKVIEAMMQTEEPALMKWVLEHAYGKPVDKVAQIHADGNDLCEVVLPNGTKISLK